MRTRHGFRAACLFTTLVLGAVLGGCSVNPATGESNLIVMSWAQERSLAAEAGPQFTNEYGGEVPDAAVKAYVEEVGSKLTRSALEQAFAEVPELEWEYTLLDSSVLNAFALPGGKVYLSRGLAERLNNEAQLAGVLGHEVGHVMARHGNQRMSKQLGMNIGLGALAVGVGLADDDSSFRQYGQYAVPALAVGGNVVMLSYGRDEELEADRLGIQYMVANGYDPKGQRQIMEILGAASAGGSRPPEWLSTHPASETRIQRIDELLKGEYAYTQGTSEYGLYPDRYKRRMLDRLATLPPATHGSESAMIDLDRPMLWCAHCADEARLAAK